MRIRVMTIITVTLLLVFANIWKTNAHTGDAETYFSAEYGGISIEVNATAENFPGANMTVEIAVSATADGVQVEYLNVSIYGFVGGHERTLLNSANLISAAPLRFNETYRTENTILVPSDVWGITLGQIFLRYNIKDLPSPERSDSFPLTTVRNVYLENLENELTELNQTYTDLLGNYSKLQENAGDIESTRTVAVILTITTVFFIATTLYLTLRRPRDYW